MNNMRTKKIGKSVFSAICLQMITIICGLITPRVILQAYGSETYGALMSITQFLSYVTLFEGGIGGVARAALYKPLADKNQKKISAIMYELKRFYRIIGCIFVLYAVIIACFYKDIAHYEYLDWSTTFFLVIAVSVSIFGQYFIGISYSSLITADQKIYLINYLSILTTCLNTVLLIVLVKNGCSILRVKLISSVVFLIKPTCMWIYVKRKYKLLYSNERDTESLKQKWVGMGQHIAYYLHSNTDVTVLTCLSDLKTVSVYSTYHMPTAHIQKLIESFCAGMGPLFGDMIARDEKEKLKTTFSIYETIISIASVILFSTVIIMIVPFVSLYTKGIKDTNYYQPLFAILITLADIVYCMRIPYHELIMAAGHFKQTKWAAYGEAFVNIMLSIILVRYLGLIGVAVGTIVAVGFRLIYYVIYLQKRIIMRRAWMFFKREIVNVLCIAFICYTANIYISRLNIDNFLKWGGIAICVVLYSCALTLICNYVFYKESFIQIVQKGKGYITHK